MQGTDVNLQPQITVMMECMLQPKKRVKLYVQMVLVLVMSLQKRMASSSKSPFFANKCNDSYLFANEYMLNNT